MFEKNFNEQDNEELKALNEIINNESDDELTEFFESDETFGELGELQRKMMSDGSFVFVNKEAYKKAVENAKAIIKTISDYEIQDVKMTVPEHNFLPSVFPDTFSILIECDIFEIRDVEKFADLIKETCEFGVSLNYEESRYAIELFYKDVVVTIPNNEHDV